MKIHNMIKRMMSKLSVLSITAIGFIYMWSRADSDNVKPPIAFTAYYTETSTDPTTGRSFQKQQLYWATRGDGTISFGWLDRQYGWRILRNPSSKTEVTVADPQKLKTTLDYSYIPLNIGRPRHPSDCRPDAGVSLMGMDTINDFEAYHYQRQTILRDG